jgi:hypothetical protein
VDDSFDEIHRKLSALDAKYADDLTRAEARFVALAQNVLRLWRVWWRDREGASAVAVEPRLNRKFLMCFPLAAHAMNHVEAALTARVAFPWIAKTSTRVAFEHALTAQWVLLTADGEATLKAGFDHRDNVRSERLIEALRRLGHADNGFAAAAHGLTDEQLSRLVRGKPDEPGPGSVESMCRRFASGGIENLLYDAYRELSGAVHPSLALLQAHLRFSSDGNVLGINTFGSSHAQTKLGRELALSAIWALYSVEVCRSGQPRMADIASMGAEAGLPVDLRSSDQQSQNQPKDQAAYWYRPPDITGFDA